MQYIYISPTINCPNIPNLYSNEHFLSIFADFYKHNIKDMQAVPNAQFKTFEHILPRPTDSVFVPLQSYMGLRAASIILGIIFGFGSDYHIPIWSRMNKHFHKSHFVGLLYWLSVKIDQLA